MKNQKGFTLIEAIFTLVILAGGVMGVLSLFQRNVDKNSEGEQTLVATTLAQEKLEQIVHDKKYQGYDYIISANYPAVENLMTIGFPNFIRTTAIQEVDGTDLTSPPSGGQPSGYKRITVGVQVTGGPVLSFTTLVTKWGEL